jgi:hypothetical protein
MRSAARQGAAVLRRGRRAVQDEEGEEEEVEAVRKRRCAWRAAAMVGGIGCRCARED